MASLTTLINKIMTSPIFELHPSISDDTVVYRTLDFFSAAAIVTNRELMFSRADTFSDKNEGIDRLLAQLEISTPNSSCGVGWHDDESARAHHDQIKRSHYISCWSLNAESVAMWSLYSPDHCSIRISTTISKLRVPIEALLTKYSLGRLSQSDRQKKVIISSAGNITPVEYTSLPGIVRKVTKRAKAYRRIADRYARKGKPFPLLTELDPRFYKRDQERRFTELRTQFRLKDISFQHEAEVRLSVRLGEGTFSEDTLELQAWLEPNHQHHAHLKEVLGSWSSVTTLSLPLREFATCPPNLIDSVAIDPRCPTHKAKFIRDWFLNHGVSVVESTCFGYLPNSFEVYPEK